MILRREGASGRVELVVRPSRSYPPGSGKLSIRLRGDESGSIRDALKDAGFVDGDQVVIVMDKRGRK